MLSLVKCVCKIYFNIIIPSEFVFSMFSHKIYYTLNKNIQEWCIFTIVQWFRVGKKINELNLISVDFRLDVRPLHIFL